MQSLQRNWLIALLTQQELPNLKPEHWHAVIDQACHDGIIVLAEKSLARHPQFAIIPSELLELFREAGKEIIFQQFVFQREQQQIFSKLTHAGIAFIVMKGAALAQWLYQSPMDRSITDIDIWLKDKTSVEMLGDLLQPLGFERQPTLGELTTHEQAFDKTVQNTTIRVDAHWALFNSAILSDSLDFDHAYKNGINLEIQNQSVKALSVNDALINSIGHRALKKLSGQENTLKWLYEQHLLFNDLDEQQWAELIKQSAESGISDLTLESIEQSQLQLNTKVEPDVIKQLSLNAKREKINRTWFASWARYQWHEMQAVSPSFTVRLQWLGQKLLPNPDAVREGYGYKQAAWKVLLKRFSVGIGRLFK